MISFIKTEASKSKKLLKYNLATKTNWPAIYLNTEGLENLSKLSFKSNIELNSIEINQEKPSNNIIFEG